MNYASPVLRQTVNDLIHAIQNQEKPPERASVKRWERHELIDLKKMKSSGMDHGTIASVFCVTVRQVEHAVARMKRLGTL